MKVNNWMKTTERFFDELFGMIGNVIIAFIRRVAPFAVPAAPAFFFAHAVYSSVESMSNSNGFAVFIGSVAALGLESAGILAAHIAVKLYGDGEKSKANVAALIALCYLVAGITGIVLFENASNDAKITGVIMFLIAGMVYILLALINDTNTAQARVEAESLAQAQEDQDQAQRQHEATQAKAQRQHEKEIAQMEQDGKLERRRTAAKDTRLRISAEARAGMLAGSQQGASRNGQGAGREPVGSGQVCQGCQRGFGSVQALNAHKGRWCKGR